MRPVALSLSLALALSSLVLGLPASAAAEEPTAVPTGTTGVQAPATSGKTEIEGQGKFGAAAAEPEEEESTDATELQIAAGGRLPTGNARAAAVTAAGNFRLRRDIHQFMAIFAGNYGAGAPAGSGYEVNVANLQGRMRYDVFFAKRWSAFLMLTGRNDRFQGLDFRVNIDPGVAFHILNKKNHRLWVEAGYDFQYDLRRWDAIIEKDEMGAPVLDMDGKYILTSPKTQTVHAARLFAGYSNHISEKVTFDTGVEYLQSLLDGKTFRINWDNALTTQLVNRFSLAATFTLRYENHPLPNVRKLDTITAMNLVYRFF
ncbi:MAG: DUF481 domain-containing protein [Myxococcales bacterium]|nr:DUF481 domain-containing protein [Myxococcales bacterium]